MTKRSSLVLISIASLLLAACGGGAAGGGAAQAGDPERGRALFQQPSLNGAPGCAACHSLEPGQVLVGPSLAGIAARAEQTVQSPAYTGQATDAAGYLRESILEPDASVREGFPSGVMFPRFADVLTDQEVDDLVAFLLTLK